jgi:hypothetical protein
MSSGLDCELLHETSMVKLAFRGTDLCAGVHHNSAVVLNDCCQAGLSK